MFALAVLAPGTGLALQLCVQTLLVTECAGRTILPVNASACTNRTLVYQMYL